MFLKKRNIGLYNSENEKDSCGIGLVANIYDIPSKKIIDNALKLLSNLTHRGAVSADPKAGDGVGILTQIPHQFFQKELAYNNFSKSLYLILSVILGLLLYLILCYFIKAFKISDIKLKY